MFGERAFKLVRDFHRSQDIIPPYDDLGVQAVLEEMKNMDQFITSFMSTTHNFSQPEERSILGLYLIQSTGVIRNKRCLHAYVWNRMQRLRQLRWEFGSMLPPDVRANLNEHEIEWFSNYSRSLTNYMKTLNHRHGLNLVQNTKPPKSLYLEVRSLVDHGKLETEDGEVVVLKKNSRHLLPWVQAEPLVRQGILEHAGSSIR
ncbi:DNA replication complex GINS protein PSF1-like [Lycorma delicatula]|uniref:DNA replication complex GINS protein PSF1-like n=1 Tax=Lycorma delicatula TaxID=130591 RepID=UPI003F51330C